MAFLTKKEKEINDVFTYTGNQALREFYSQIIYWKTIYKGYVEDWHKIYEPTIKNNCRFRNISRLNTAKMLCSGLADYIFNEKCKINVSVNDEERTKILNAFVNSVLKDNNFFVNYRKLIEQAMALGGGCVKTIVAFNDYKQKYEVVLDYINADSFIPLSWTNSKITECCFISKIYKNGYYYTKLEFHTIQDDKINIQSQLFRSVNQGVLGVIVPINEIYPNIEENVEIEEIEHSLFSYFPVNETNNIDDNSPLGCSVFANSIDTIRNIDLVFDSLKQEIKLGKKRIIVPTSALREVIDQDGNKHRYFDSDDSVFQAMSFDSLENLKIEDNTVELRVEQIRLALNTMLNLLCLQLGVNVGSFSFDEARGIKTATEVISENSKTYKKIKNLQEPIKKTIEDVVFSIVDIAKLYDLDFEFEGKTYKINDVVKENVQISVVFDDSIVQDKDSDINRGVMLVNNGLMSKKHFLVNVLGYTEQQAEAELESITNETPKIDFTNIE